MKNNIILSDKMNQLGIFFTPIICPVDQSILLLQKYNRSAHQTIHTKLFLPHPAMELLRPSCCRASWHVAANLYPASFCIGHIHYFSILYDLRVSIAVRRLHNSAKENTNVLFSFLQEPHRLMCFCGLINCSGLNDEPHLSH